MRSKRTVITYLDAYTRFWKEVPSGTGDDSSSQWRVLHPSLNSTGTDTLRWTMSNPNSANVKKGEDGPRACFGPMPGREWWACDAENIELRLPAYAAGEQDMIDLFEKPDDPPYYGSNHLLNFHTVYPDIWEKVLEEVGIEKVGPHCKEVFKRTWYQYCKNGGFAIQYNAGKNTADKAFHRNGCFDLLKRRFRKIEALNRKCIDHANKYGYVEVMPDRTVDPSRGYPLVCTRTENGRILETVPLSYFIQGTAMQWTNKAMIRCDAQLREWKKRLNYDGFITLQVHDELEFDLPQRADPRKNPRTSNLGKVKILRTLMEEGGRDIGIPTPTSCTYHPVHWGEGVSF